MAAGTTPRDATPYPSILFYPSLGSKLPARPRAGGGEEVIQRWRS